MTQFCVCILQVKSVVFTVCAYIILNILLGFKIVDSAFLYYIQDLRSNAEYYYQHNYSNCDVTFLHRVLDDKNQSKTVALKFLDFICDFNATQHQLLPIGFHVNIDNNQV